MQGAANLPLAAAPPEPGGRALSQHFVFWQNMPAHHQSAWIAAVAGRAARADVIFESDVSPERRACGWTMPDVGRATVRSVGICPAEAREIFARSEPSAIHIFGGIGAYPAIYAAFRSAVRARARIGVVTEGVFLAGAHLTLLPARYLRYRSYSFRFASAIQFILAIGNGARWFTAAGFPRAQVFPFAYTVPEPPADERARDGHWTGEGPRLVFIGRLVALKRCGMLLRALAAVRDLRWQAVIVGDGPKRLGLERTAERLGIARRVRFLGSRPNAEAMEVLRGADLLAIQSSHEGFGAVVSEALVRGVPVLCSDRCGASEIVASNRAFGEVFHEEAGLKCALRKWLGKGRLSAEDRAELVSAARVIGPQNAASYLMDVVSHVYSGAPRPRPPWSTPS